MIEVERSGGRLRLRACRSGENSTAVNWHALPKTSAEIEPHFRAAFEVGDDASRVVAGGGESLARLAAAHL